MNNIKLFWGKARAEELLSVIEKNRDRYGLHPDTEFYIDETDWLYANNIISHDVDYVRGICHGILTK